SILYNSDGELDFNSSQKISAFSIQHNITLQGRPWTIYYNSPQNPLLGSAEAKQPLYVLIAGVMVDILLFYVIVSLHFINRHSKASALSLKIQHDENLNEIEIERKNVYDAKREAEIF